MNFPYRWTVLGMTSSGCLMALWNRNTRESAKNAAEEGMKDRDYNEYVVFYLVDREDHRAVVDKGERSIPKPPQAINWGLR